MDETRAAAFLYFGWDPTREGADELAPWQRLDPGRRNELTTMSRDRLVVQGMKDLDRALTADSGPRLHIVPLSGGKDSRAILGALVDQGLRDEVITVTLGTPGTIDYELGARVARRAGVTNERIDLTRIVVDRASLRRFASTDRGLVNLFPAYWNSLPYARIGSDHLYWTGYMGGPVGGDHFMSPKSASWHEAIARWLERPAPQRNFGPPRWPLDPFAVWPREARLPNTKLNFDDQFEFTIVQPRCVFPQVMPNGYRYRAPYIDPSWTNFIMHVGANERQGGSLYDAILARRFPDLFSLPVQAGLARLGSHGVRRSLSRGSIYGRIRLHHAMRPRVWRSPIASNFVGVADAIRRRPDIRTVVRDSIEDLEARDFVPWVKPRDLLRRHLEGTADFGVALQLLTSLSIYLEAEESEQVHGDRQATDRPQEP